MEEKSELEQMFLAVNYLYAKSQHIKNYNERSFIELCDFAEEVKSKTNSPHIKDEFFTLSGIWQKLQQFRNVNPSPHKNDVFKEELSDLKYWLLGQKNLLAEKMRDEKK